MDPMCGQCMPGLKTATTTMSILHIPTELVNTSSETQHTSLTFFSYCEITNGSIKFALIIKHFGTSGNLIVLIPKVQKLS